MNIFFLIIGGFLIFNYLLHLVTEYLNVSAISSDLPEAFAQHYDPDTYKQSQDYLRVRTRFSMFQSTLSLIVTLSFFVCGGFNTLDSWLRPLSDSSVVIGLLYMGALFLLMQVLSLPFSYYSTFVIEERFGFNKTTIKVFVSDLIKSVVVSTLILVPMLGLTLWFFESLGTYAWAYVWGFLSVFQLVIAFFAPTVIMPLFNTFEPIKDKDLEEKVLSYAKKENFSLKGLYQMDGSKRSSKSNAFFTGFGANKRIVLFDTLIERHSHDELLAVLAHEMGHYKKKHIHKSIVLSLINSFVMLFVLSKFMNNELLFAAFQMQELSVYASLVFFGMLYSPIEFFLSIFSSYLSRKHEFEADAYAIDTTGLKEAFILALKKLSVDNLSNLKPHALKVFLEYSHPPVLQRIEAIKNRS